MTNEGHSRSGRISVTDDVARFLGSTMCNGVGEYRWAVDDDVLTFDPIAPDECPGRQKGLEGHAFELISRLS